MKKDPNRIYGYYIVNPERNIVVLDTKICRHFHPNSPPVAITEEEYMRSDISSFVGRGDLLETKTPEPRKNFCIECQHCLAKTSDTPLCSSKTLLYNKSQWVGKTPREMPCYLLNKDGWCNEFVPDRKED